MVDIATIISAILGIVGSATIAFRVIAPLTANKKDDHVLKYLEAFLAAVALDTSSKDGDVLKIKLKR